MRLLFVTRLGGSPQYQMRWRSDVRLLMVSRLNPYSRPTRTIASYVEVGRRLGHEAVLFGEPLPDLPSIPTTVDPAGFDAVVFVVYESNDFPDLPYLARLLDGTDRDRRVVIDCSGRYNATVRVDHDFNHLEKLEGHQGWEWIEGFEAVSGRILQPTPTPQRDDVTPFLFHAYDPRHVARPYGSPAEAAEVWNAANGSAKPYGVAYLGNNWQRWSQVRQFLVGIEPIRDRLGPICLNGWDWDRRPEWAAQLGIAGIDVDPELLTRLGVEVRWGVPFDEFTDFLGQARFVPVFQRPLYNHLRLVSNRVFETFCADTIPLLFLPADLAAALYGDAAADLTPDGDPAGFCEKVMADPVPYWAAVLAAREHLAQEHSFERRFGQLLDILA